MKTQNILFISYLIFAWTRTVFSQNVKAMPKKKQKGTPKRYQYKSPVTSPSLGTANKVPTKKVVKKTGGGGQPPTINTNPNNRPPNNNPNNRPPNNNNPKNARRNCRLCTETWSVPNPNLILLDETCSYWNNRDMPLENCSNIQATYGSACGCPNAPKPVCDVCPNGDYVWKEAPQYNTFTDDFCVRMIYRMSKRTEFCDGNKRRVASMCCSNTCSSGGAPPGSSPKTSGKVTKKYGKKEQKSGDDKSSKTSKSYATKSKANDVPPVVQDYYSEGPDTYYYYYYYR
jgi:hypothetical protein